MACKIQHEPLHPIRPRLSREGEPLPDLFGCAVVSAIRFETPRGKPKLSRPYLLMKPLGLLRERAGR